MKRRLTPYVLGPNVLQLMLPQRPPFLMVDRLVAVAREGRRGLQTEKYLSMAEPVFAGHFPDAAIFPGALLLEGVSQTAQLLTILTFAERDLVESGHEAEHLWGSLRNLQLGVCLEPGYDPEAGEAFLALLRSNGRSTIGLTAQANVKFLAPVFAGSRVDFLVQLQREIEHLCHFRVEAEVEGKLVLEGSLSGAYLQQGPPRLLLGGG